VLRDIFDFLNVDSVFYPEVAIRYNASGVPRNEAVHTTLQTLRLIKPVAERYLTKGWYQYLLRVGSNIHNNNLLKPQLSSDVRRRVINDHFREDILNLQDLILRDLSAWLR